ncbi:hypothetical protein Pla22_02180 [Rubripirellula amarantea]|uniref:Uncharacterized protein n=1 Tax=Rubripirellula amarantea TaxID=2527999 RepID=A0A5C5WP40_9BACT|nr:hypothetical protein [Rubripirellula amarantea]TWT52594.1 hypothetical protein Pla22_02180 [Rubripirellula amarantea]
MKFHRYIPNCDRHIVKLMFPGRSIEASHLLLMTLLVLVPTLETTAQQISSSTTANVPRASDTSGLLASASDAGASPSQDQVTGSGQRFASGTDFAADSASGVPGSTSMTPSLGAMSPAPASSQPQPAETPSTSLQAERLLHQILGHLVNGPAFDAKVRETVHASKRKVIGVGTYEQTGGGSGRYHMQLTMHDGDGKHRLDQINDGRLAWTRQEIAEAITLRRVDVARLDEWIAEDQRLLGLPPRLLVGGWAEMLVSLERDYDLRLDSATLSGNPVMVIVGDLNAQARTRILNSSGSDRLPDLYPSRVQVAIATKNDTESSVGKWLPIRWEYRSEPRQITSEDGTTRMTNGALITLIELYSIRPIEPPPADRFRFDNQDADVMFTNETDRYMESYGVRLTERERIQLRR